MGKLLPEYPSIDRGGRLHDNLDESARKVYIRNAQLA